MDGELTTEGHSDRDRSSVERDWLSCFFKRRSGNYLGSARGPWNESLTGHMQAWKYAAHIPCTTGVVWGSQVGCFVGLTFYVMRCCESGVLLNKVNLIRHFPLCRGGMVTMLVDLNPFTVYSYSGALC